MNIKENISNNTQAVKLQKAVQEETIFVRLQENQFPESGI